MNASERAAEINAATVARAEAEGWVCYGLLVTDQSHWTAEDVHTGDDLDAYLSYCDYVDAYKEAVGIKPRWLSWWERTAAEWQAALADI